MVRESCLIEVSAHSSIHGLAWHSQLEGLAVHASAFIKRSDAIEIVTCLELGKDYVFRSRLRVNRSDVSFLSEGGEVLKALSAFIVI